MRDFPLHCKACYLKIKRRKWLNEDTGKIVYRNWKLVANDIRMTKEFVVFLSERRTESNYWIIRLLVSLWIR